MQMYFLQVGSPAADVLNMCFAHTLIFLEQLCTQDSIFRYSHFVGKLINRVKVVIWTRNKGRKQSVAYEWWRKGTRKLSANIQNSLNVENVLLFYLCHVQ